MAEILKKEQLSDAVWRFRLHAPRIARCRRAGQFVILRPDETSERIPLTIANADADAGWIEIIFQTVGETTMRLRDLNEGDSARDLAGPLGRPTHIENFGRALCVGGGVGAAPLYPIINALHNAGNDVTSVIGARSKELVILENDIKASSSRLIVATDDGSYGAKGFVSDVFKSLVDAGEKFDAAFVIGPAMMMKATCALTVAAGIRTFASLNPIMIDGTGMCGGCRVTVGGETKFACVDGPEFDASQIDWDEMVARLGGYRDFEARARENYSHPCKARDGLTEEEAGALPPTPPAAGNAPGKDRFARIPMREQDAAARGRNFQEVPYGYSDGEAKAEASRCLRCKKPLCVDGCPVNVKIPEFIGLIADGEFAAAARKIRETNALPAICGRVCPQEEQCECHCVLAKKGDPVAIGNLERFAADWERGHGGGEPPEKKPPNGKRVAVAGSGPAGLTCAGELVRDGFDVTVFEALHEAGGVLVYGIPEFRLPKSIVQKEIECLEALGVKIVKNFVVGRTASIDDLLDKEGFDAVFVGSGAGLPSFMGIKGENSVGVYSANEYLTRSNLMKAYVESPSTPIMKGRRVITVGGGNVAMDAARTALRLGAEKSMVVYRRSEAEMPARNAEIHHAKEEGIEFHLLCNPVEIVASRGGAVAGVKCARMELGEPDASGRRRPVAVRGSEFVLDCDVVVIAIGNSPNPLIPETTQGLDVSAKRGTIVAGESDGRTSKKSVYAGGDIVTGAATVILAMGAGKAAARSITMDLTGAD